MNPLKALAKPLLAHVQRLLTQSSNKQAVAAFRVDETMASELTTLIVACAERWSVLSFDQKDGFDAICAALHGDPCDLRRQVWEQRFHRISRKDPHTFERENDHQGKRKRMVSVCQTCGAEVSEPAVCPKAPDAARVWQPGIGEVVWVHGRNDPFLTALRFIAGEERPTLPAPLYRIQPSPLAGYIEYAIRVRDRIMECMQRWPRYEPVPDHPTTWTNDYVHDAEGRLYPVCYHRNRARLHDELLPRYIKDFSQTPLARAIAEAAAAGTLTVLDPKLHELDRAIRAYADCLLKSNDATDKELLRLNEAISALVPYADTGGRAAKPAIGAGLGELTSDLETGLASWNALSDRQRNCMQALLEMKAFNADSRQRTTDVAAKAEGPQANVEGFKEPLSNLVVQGLVQSKTGRGGGYWLTGHGRKLVLAALNHSS